LAILFLLLPGTGCNRVTPPEPTVEEPAVKDPSVSLQVTSDDFEAGQPLPRACTGEGEDRSPQVAWSQVPPATRELALVCDDPDAPSTSPWVHWVLYGLAGDVTSLPAGLPPDKTLSQPVTARQGRNAWPSGQTIGYRGPMPPAGHGVHHYHFKLYALDTRLDLPAGATKEQLVQAMHGHVLATGELVGTYERK
jgi:Raf kinase inhibitor-like YbhB/YbcL family protein